MFSGAFASVFSGSAALVLPAGYIGPAMAQAALAGGAAWEFVAGELRIDGRRLIGPAGRVYSFASGETAARWAENAALASVRELRAVSGLSGEQAAKWKAEKRARLEVIAERVVSAAAKTADADKRAALIAEAGYLLGKWAA